MKSILKRFAVFLSVAGHVFIRGVKAAPFAALFCILFEALSFFWLIAAATSLALLAAGRGKAGLPSEIMQFIPEGQEFAFGAMGLLVSLLGGALTKFLANYVVNISVPKIETRFYEESARNFAKADIVTLSQLDLDPTTYLKRDLSINARYAMMVYRRLILTVFPLATLFVLLPVLIMKNLEITLIMGAVFILMLPVYYWINRKSNQITLDMEKLGREVSQRRRDAAESLIGPDYSPDHAVEVLAPTLSNHNEKIKRFFHLYGERFTMSEATNLANAFVLFFVVGALAWLTFRESGTRSATLNIADFLIILLVLRQVHTVVSRGLLVTNLLSRFYTKLLALKNVNARLKRLNSGNRDRELAPEPVGELRYKHLISGKASLFDMRPGNVHVLYDVHPPSRLSLLGLKPPTDVKNFAGFLIHYTTGIVPFEPPSFTFAGQLADGIDLDNLIAQHMDLLQYLYTPDDLRRIPDDPTDLVQIMKDTLGDGISWLRPRTIKLYEFMIDLQNRLAERHEDVIFLDARLLIRFKPPYFEKALDLMRQSKKLIFITLLKHNRSQLDFASETPVIIKGDKQAEGYVTYAELANLDERKTNQSNDDDIDDELNMV